MSTSPYFKAIYDTDLINAYFLKMDYSNQDFVLNFTNESLSYNPDFEDLIPTSQYKHSLVINLQLLPQEYRVRYFPKMLARYFKEITQALLEKPIEYDLFFYDYVNDVYFTI